MLQQAEILESVLERYPSKPEYLIFMLQDIQADCGYIAPESMEIICEHANVPITQGYSVATFYQSFRLEPQGEHEIKVCLGTACHLKGGERLVENLERKLGIHRGETTEDMMFTLNTVNCLGACAMAPVAVVDDEYISSTTPAKLDKSLKAAQQQ
ncbi:MAG: NAD(P)H-dependent oxidoreductase subunit E [Desulfosalsimonadaceae bacterium]